MPSFCLNPSLVESEMNINVNGKSLEINNDYDQHLTMNISMESITSSMINRNPKYEVQLNSFKISISSFIYLDVIFYKMGKSP